MKLIDAIMLSLSVAFFIIGVHQTMLSGTSVAEGVANAYVFYMISLLLMIWHRARRKNQPVDEEKKRANKKRNKRGLK